MIQQQLNKTYNFYQQLTFQTRQYFKFYFKKMCKTNTGLSSNTNSNENEITPNTNIEIVQDEQFDSDSDSNYEERSAYMLLGQNPHPVDNIYSDDSASSDEETEEDKATSIWLTLTETLNKHSTLTEEIWSTPAPKEVDIEMSQKKIDLVKQVMLNVQLPNDAIPEWAKNVPEDEWKNHLLCKLKESKNNG